ncbi:MAG: histidine phosphatase family protein [Candidatus Nanoarchaeia archaeon]|nr:histidine phosphatase family protein [Candidatus Nanoarchaeia archaeon]
MIKITYFVHGTTNDNEKELSSGWKDADLSAKGIQQSINLKENVKNIKFDAVFCSDLKRAVESARLTFGNNIIQDKRLRECNYGIFNGNKSIIVEPMQEKCIDKKFPDGESYEDVKKRIKSFLEFLNKNYQEKHIAIVSHKAPQLALDVLLKGKTWNQAFEQDWRKNKNWQPGWEYIIK